MGPNSQKLAENLLVAVAQDSVLAHVYIDCMILENITAIFAMMHTDVLAKNFFQACK